MLRYALVAGLLLGSAAHAQMRVAPLSEIYESYNDCFAATEKEIDVSALEARGWQRATMRSADGEPIEGGPDIFGHSDRAPIIMLSGTQGAGVCVVTARLKDRLSALSSQHPRRANKCPSS